MTLNPVRPTCETLDVVIANGASLSPAYNLNGRVVTGIIMPASWTLAGITFQASHDNVTFVDVFDLGVELSIAAAAASRYIALNNVLFLGINFIKIRSGTLGLPVAQGGARNLILMCGSFSDMR